MCLTGQGECLRWCNEEFECEALSRVPLALFVLFAPAACGPIVHPHLTPSSPKIHLVQDILDTPGRSSHEIHETAMIPAMRKEMKDSLG
jgi:hypothetical protein